MGIPKFGGFITIIFIKKMSSSGTHFKKHEEQLASGNLRIFLPKSFNLGVASCNRILAILKYNTTKIVVKTV